MSSALLASHLVYPDFVETYPFVAGDSHDWIANGLHWAGYDVRYTVRPPLIPWVMAALARTNLLPLFPLLTPLLLHVTAVAAFVHMRAPYGSTVAAIVTLGMLFNHALLGFSLEVMADVPAACLLFLGLVCFARSADNPRWYVAAGALAGLAALAQQVAVLAGLAVLACVVLRRRSHLRSPWLAVGTLGLVAPLALWQLSKLLTFGSISDVGVWQWGLVRPHLDAVPDYAFRWVAFLGWPGAALAVAGAIVALRSRRANGTARPTLAVVAVIGGFFVFLYDYPDGRFLTQVAWPMSVLVAAAARSITSAAARRAALLAFTLWSVVPTIDRVGGLTVFPIPHVELRVPAAPDPGTSAMRLGITRPSVSLGGPSDVARASVFARVRVAFRERRAPVRQDLAAVDGVDSALLLYGDDREVANRYGLVTRLGNILRTRVKLVPEPVFSQGLTLLWAVELQPLEAFRVFRVGVAGFDRSWLVLVRESSPLAGRLGAARSMAAGSPAMDAAAGLEAARRLLRAAAGPNPEMIVAVVRDQGEVELSQFFVAFLAHSTGLMYVDPPDLAEARAALGLVCHGPAERVDGVQVQRVRLLGQTAVLLMYTSVEPQAREIAP